MSCRLTYLGGRVVLHDPERCLRGRQHSQMAVWGFVYDQGSNTYTSAGDQTALVGKVSDYLSRAGVAVEVSSEAGSVQADLRAAHERLIQAMSNGARFKNANGASSEFREFLDLLAGLPRHLKAHQIKAAVHLLTVGNGANFSVPGSGKTTVVLSVFEWLRRKHVANCLFVVGPPSCFGPWRDEYESTLGTRPTVRILAGGDIEERKRSYFPASGDVRDLYLTSYHTLQRDAELVKRFFSQLGVNVALVVDEAHYIKQAGGAWARAVLSVAPLAKWRVILTGTPFPQSYADAYNYFDVLWPGDSPIPQSERIRIATHMQRKEEQQAGAVLNQCIGPLFYRVRKRDLGLAPQEFHAPVQVKMKGHERHIYDLVLNKIRALAINDDYHDFELLTRLRQGRMMRLRQCISYAKLLRTAVSHYEENLLGDNPSLANTIRRYDALERPAKIDATIRLVSTLLDAGEKVVIWSTFVQTLRLLRRTVEQMGSRAELIYGGTPTEATPASEALSREEIIKEFKSSTSGLDVLIANPAACAESISLHTSCSHAIYYDLSYNCAQYLQSLDRIHRVGGSENKVAHYYFLQYENSIDQDILRALKRKADNMSAVIDQDCSVYDLDMFAEEDELAAYERLFR